MHLVLQREDVHLVLHFEKRRITLIDTNAPPPPGEGGAFSLTNYKESIMSHLTESDRQQIEYALRHRLSFEKIADDLKKSRSTILREVLKHRQASQKVSPWRISNCCIHRHNCDYHRLCPNRRCHRKCSACSLCNTICPRFQEEVCSRLSTPPYVCNGCSDETQCPLRKAFYIHEAAEKEYRKLLLEARRGVNLTEAEKMELDRLIHAGIQKGQSIHHIMIANKDSFTVCEKSVYGYVNAGILHTKRGDMPKSCMMKPRKHKNLEHKVDPKCRISRTYDDFILFCKENPDSAIVEMDSVIGNIGGKVLLTLQFNTCGLMLAFLRDSNNSQSVIDIFNRLEQWFGIAVFRNLFPILLTDNDSEFSNPTALEKSPFTGEQRTRIFYCNPFSSWQKGHIENNHLNMRKILEKGTSFDALTQAKINIVLSHVNSFARKSLNDVPSITLFETLYGKSILGRLGIQLIPPNHVQLTPDLIMKH